MEVVEAAFRKTVLEVSQSLEADDLEKIVYLHRVPEPTSTINALKTLERRGLFSHSHPNGLAGLLSTIHRGDLCALVQDYCRRYTVHHSCCGEKPCIYVSGRLELCSKEAQHTLKAVSRLQERLEEFFNSQRSTPKGDQFVGSMKASFEQVQRDFKKYMITPLGEVQEHLAQRPEGNKDTQTTAQESPSTNTQTETNRTLAKISTRSPSGRLYRSKSMEWDGPDKDYDTLEPKASPAASIGTRATRIPIATARTAIEGRGRGSPGPGSPGLSRHNTPGSPHRARLTKSGSSIRRMSESCDYSVPTSTSRSADDSGFVEPRIHPGNRNLGGQGERQLPHAWRESRQSVYTSLNFATTNTESPIYMSPRPANTSP